MNDNEFNFERRRQRAYERFGTNHPTCAHCGNTDWRCLELHHVADRGADHTRVILCSNCHCIVTFAQHWHPSHDAVSDPLLEQIGRFLLGLADLLRIAAEKLLEFGRSLVERAAADPDEGASQ